MVQPAQSTAGHDANVREKLSDSDEDGFQQYLLRNADHAIRSWAEHRMVFPTTSALDQDIEVQTMPDFKSRERDSDLLSRIVKLPQPQVRKSPTVSFDALQEWEGYVTEIKETEFTARLTDLTSGANYASEEANIPLDEISEDDAAKMQVGSIFRWVIGYERRGGSKKRVSQIVLRDLPVITKSDLRDGREWAHSIVTTFQQ